ncbi:MAG: glycosyltransferase family 39 protein [Bacteroidota bacterium]
MSQARKYSLFWAALGGLLFLPGLGQVHLFDWDEINFAEISREMLVLEDYLRVYVNFEPFWEKPPMFFWLQALSMKVFGVNEFAARFPNAVCGIFTLVLLYRMGRFLRGHRFGMLWAGAYLGSILPHLYFRSGIIDPWFNLFIFLGLSGLIAFSWLREKSFDLPLKGKNRYLIGGGLFLGLAVLVKGPAALVIVGLTGLIYWAFRRFYLFVSIPQAVLYLLVALLPPLIWLGVETWSNGPGFASAFTRYQYRLFTTSDAGHAGFPAYHFVVLLFGCFPSSILAIKALGARHLENNRDRDAWMWMLILLAVVLILFSIVQSKIVHYSSMCYFPLTYLAAVSGHHIMGRRLNWSAWMSGLLLFIGGLASLVCLAAPFVGRHPEWLRPLLSKDEFALGNLEAEVYWSWWTLIPGFLLLGLVLVAYRNLRSGQFPRAFSYLYAGTAAFMFLGLSFFIGRIERYSQGAAIDFYKQLAGEDAYVMTYGFKSYAHIFYFKKPLPGDFGQVSASDIDEMSFQQLRSSNPDWLLHGDIDKDVYIVTKITKADQLLNIPEVVEISRSNGFVFCKRTASKQG